MTNIDTWPPWVAIIFAGGPILLAAAGLAFSLYLTHCHLEAMKEALKNSRYMYIWGTSLGRRGLIWSLLEMSKIAGMVVWPRASIIMGEVDPVDIEKFPPYLKRLLVIDLAMMIVACIWMGVVVVLLRFR
ncbi:MULTISPECIES: hypothetical protein [Pseudomonas]|jgi:hypothetical protein|uniref:hypothetical protein n=1 Tax=Pseudomonas TaxID=286 RepID=UPI00054B3900|nr:MULTISPECIES: hypothetical protein [Pseudomonas]ATN12921.1 hypothetical protein CRN80_26270 [Pseudomonas sp. FDAARGOS_380]MBA5957132.1 hypothetical protein [Pseudomonas lactis]MBA6041645.1 hypothetical protein [Pseudomonas lactis]MBC6627169.1 hypothetical protein [Pseudomonas sp.]MBH3465685.1 hypothetical protein [Pseudomonas carnis]